MSTANLLRVALPTSDWEDPSGSGVLDFQDVDYPMDEPVYAVVPLEFNGDGRDDLFLCRGQGYKSSRWQLGLTRDVANTEGGTYGWDFHDTGVACSPQDEYTVLPHERGTEVLAVIPRFGNHPEPSAFANDEAYKNANYTIAESLRGGYRTLEFDPETGVGGLSAAEVLPRDLYQRWTDRECNNGFVASHESDAAIAGLGAPLLGAGLSRDRAFDVDGDGNRDIVRFELSGGDTAANLAAIQAETEDDGSGYASRNPNCGATLGEQSGVLRVYRNTGDGYEALDDAAHVFPGSPHANLWVNWYGAQLRDWNADGLLDILLPSNGVPTDDGVPNEDWTLLLSEGDGSFLSLQVPGPAWPHYLAGGDVQEIFQDLSDRRTFAARLDNGFAAQVFLQPYRLHVPPVGTPPQIWNSNHAGGVRLERATDGFEFWSAFEYVRSSSGRMLVRERSANVPSDEPYEVGVGGATERTWTYEYGDPVLDAYGRTELGFSWVREVFVQPGVLVRSAQRRFYDWTYDANLRSYPYAGRPTTVESAWVSSRGEPDETWQIGCQQVESWAVAPQAISGGQIWQSYPDTVESFSTTQPPSGYDIDHDGPSQCGDYSSIDYRTHSTSAQTRDEYGNVIESTRAVLEGVNEATSTTTVVEDPNYDAANWVIAAPSRFTTTDCSGLDCKDRESAVWYLPNSTVPAQLYRELGTEFEQSSSLGYDAFGNVDSVEIYAPGERTRSVTSTWDAEGVGLVSRTNTLGHTTNFVTHSATGLPVATVDPNGLTQKVAYDGFFRPVGGSYHSSPLGPSDGADADMEYAASTVAGAVYDETVERRGQRVVSSYDRAGRVVREMWRGVADANNFPVSSALAISEHCRWHEYNLYGNEIGTSEASSCSAPPVGDEHWVRRDFDYGGRNVLSTWHDDGGVVESRTEFDGLSWPAVAADVGIDAIEGRAALTTSPDNNTTMSIVDALGRTSATVDALGTMTCFDYGPFGELEEVTRNCAHGASGPVETSSYQYDGLSRLTSWDEPARGVQSYTYTGFDELESITDAKAQVIEHEYDDLGRLRVRRSPDCMARWSFDGELVGALAFQLSEDGVRQSYSYDAFGRIERTEHEVPGVQPEGPWAFEFGYDVQGRLGSISYPSGSLSPLGGDAPANFSVAFDYDGSDHLRSVRGAGRVLWGLNSANDAGQPLLESFNLNHALPVQTKTSGYHDFTQRIDSLSVEAGGGVVQSFDYAWSPGGNLESRAELTTGQQEAFEYDALNRLTTINGSTAASYDELGNFTSRDGVGAYGYDPATGRLDWFGDESNEVAHDPNGNVERIGDVQLIWNPFDKVERLSRPGEQLAFTYDADGQRVARFDGTGFTLTLGGLFELSSHETQGGSVERRARYFVPAGSSTVEVRDTELQAGTWDREVLYQYTDHLGSGSVLVADDGSVDPSDRVSYDAWGQARDWFQWNQSFDPSQLQDFAAGFTGHQPELDAGLVNMRGRMYSSELARFLSVDPVVEAAGDAQTWNGYSYVLNNPLRFVDPTGLYYSEVCGGNVRKGALDCRGTDGVGRGANGKETDGAAGQSLPGQGSGPSGNTSSDTANNAGGAGGKSGMAGGSNSGTNPRGEGGPGLEAFCADPDPSCGNGDMAFLLWDAQRDAANEARQREQDRIRAGRQGARRRAAANPGRPCAMGEALCDSQNGLSVGVGLAARSQGGQSEMGAAAVLAVMGVASGPIAGAGTASELVAALALLLRGATRGAPQLGGFARGVAPHEIVAINQSLGGSTLLFGAGSLESALAGAYFYKGFFEKSAQVIRGIAGGHLFDDANKRTATAVYELLRARNGVSSGVGASELKSIIGQISRGELTEVEDIAKALRGF